MRVAAVTVRDFRGYENARAAFGDGLTVITGPNGAGKTNLLEALYFGCTGRSCRTNNEREVVRFGAARRGSSWTPTARTARTSCRSASRPVSRSGCASTGRTSNGCSTSRIARSSACSCPIGSS